jgi:hypothetical protein
MHLVRNIVTDEKDFELSPANRKALRGMGEEVAEHIETIEALRKRILDVQTAANLMAGKSLAVIRPWKLVKATILELNRPITWREALESAVMSANISQSVQPMVDLKRSVSLAKELKVVNDLIGLSEWAEDRYA